MQITKLNSKYLKNFPDLVHGGYGEWEAAGGCSKSCGGGEQVFRRKCDRPIPANNGRNCSALGPAEEKRECNTQPCPGKELYLIYIFSLFLLIVLA